MLNRLIQAIVLNDSNSLYQIAKTIIEERKKKGHERLAKQLEDIINSNDVSKQAEQLKSNNGVVNEMTVLPVSRRHNQTLATVIPREKLKHHMILSEALESDLTK